MFQGIVIQQNISQHICAKKTYCMISHVLHSHGESLYQLHVAYQVNKSAREYDSLALPDLSFLFFIRLGFLPTQWKRKRRSGNARLRILLNCSPEVMHSYSVCYVIPSRVKLPMCATLLIHIIQKICCWCLMSSSWQTNSLVWGIPRHSQCRHPQSCQ